MLRLHLVDFLLHILSVILLLLILFIVNIFFLITAFIFIILIIGFIPLTGRLSKVWCEGISHHSERTLGQTNTQIWIFY